MKSFMFSFFSSSVYCSVLFGVKALAFPCSYGMLDDDDDAGDLVIERMTTQRMCIQYQCNSK